MKYLKIEANKGYFRLGEKDPWIEIDQIGKEHLLSLLRIATVSEFEMDRYEDEKLQNPAHNIIYRNIHGKFNELLDNKSRFVDSAEAMYKSAIEKYRKHE